ncbi:MAG TPA: ABC transporter permease [Candidatus Dormibacteraeota bacterium]|nr:ABC transporter permease [Candidatus Dormibacteraeota bacterium]
MRTKTRRVSAWKVTVEIARRDLLDLWRAKMLLVFFIMMPLLFMTMFGFIYPPTVQVNPYSGQIPSPYPNLNLAIVQQDNGQIARNVEAQFIQIAQTQGIFRVKEVTDYSTARNGIVEGQLSGIVVIPNGFSDAIQANTQATIQLTVDQTNPSVAAAVQTEVAEIFGAIQSQISTQFLQQKLDPPVSSTFVLEPISITNTPLIQGVPTSFEYLAPSFMALTVITGALNGVSTAISREKEQGTMDGLLVAPIPRQSVILGKIVAQTARGLIQGFLILGLSILLFGVVIYGSPITMLLVMVLGVGSFIGVGIIMTTLAPEQETAQMMTALLQFPMMFLSGILFPINQLPVPVQYIGKAFPLYYAADALRKVVILNANIGIIMPDLLVLLAYSVVTMGIAVPIFNRAMSR